MHETTIIKQNITLGQWLLMMRTRLGLRTTSWWARLVILYITTLITLITFITLITIFLLVLLIACFFTCSSNFRLTVDTRMAA